MDLRMRQKSVLNVWPAFTDVSIAMLLIFLFFLFYQFVSNSKLFQKMRMEKKQQTIETVFKNEFSEQEYKYTIKVDGNLQRFTFSDDILFDKGKKELKSEGEEILITVGNFFKKYKSDKELGQLYQKIQIEGHTDNDPYMTYNPSYPGRLIISTKYTNWELSSDRAIAVLRLFEKIGIDPRTLTATGYSKYRPAPDAGGSSDISRANNNEINKAKNRRIEIVLVYSETEDSK